MDCRDRTDESRALHCFRGLEKNEIVDAKREVEMLEIKMPFLLEGKIGPRSSE